MGSGVTREELRRSMNLSIVSGATGTLWMIVCAPQAIFNVFLRNVLGATSSQLGLLVGILSMSSVLQLAAILIYRRLPRRKPYWIITSVVHRLNGPVLAYAAFSVARGATREYAIAVVFAAMVASWVITNLSSSGWWNWMADLVPLDVRARFFGRRSAVAQIVNIAAFFGTTVALDAATLDNRLIVYGIVFLIGGLGGIVDILVHILIPEPRPDRSRSCDDAALSEELVLPVDDPVEPPDGESAIRSFFSPLLDRNFRRFALTTGMVLFSINVSAPFFAPYVTDPSTIGAPNTWLGIMFVISQSIWIAVSSGWGTVMDQFGRKPVVMIGLLFTVSWIGYLVLTPTNYFIVLPIIAMVGGLLAPAFWDGINQLMLSLTQERNRLTYIAWYWTLIGVISAGGSLGGGFLDDLLRGRTVQVLFVEITGFHGVVITSLVLVAISLLVLSRIDEGPVKDVGFVFSRVATPSIFRTFLNIGVLAKNDSSERVARTLRAIDSASDDLALEQVLGRVHDPDSEVREEAVRALGRLRSPQATDALLDLLNDPSSTTRVQAARALGRIGEKRAVPLLVDAMDGASEELREACAGAIGQIGGEASVGFLTDLLRADASDSVAAGTATAVSYSGAFEAAWEIVPRLHRTTNPVLRTQLAIALANLLGRPGEFYRYVTGDEAQQQSRARRLVQEAERGLRVILGGAAPGAGTAASMARQVQGYSLVIRAERWRSALESLYAAVDERWRGELGPGADLLKHLYDLNPRTGLWYWFIRESLVLPEGSPANSRLELLVALYYLRTLGQRAPSHRPAGPRSAGGSPAGGAS